MRSAGKGRATRHGEMHGAEAVLRREKFLGQPVVVKERIPKKYRAEALDVRLRLLRTRREAKLLHQVKSQGVFCPLVLKLADYEVTMSFLPGCLFSHWLQRSHPAQERRRHLHSAARIIAGIHKAEVVHGDFTPANLMVTPQGLAVIDFGLGKTSRRREDQAIDLLTMKKALGGQCRPFLAAYARCGDASLLKLVSEIEQRGRYQEKV